MTTTHQTANTSDAAVRAASFLVHDTGSFLRDVAEHELADAVDAVAALRANASYENAESVCLGFRGAAIAVFDLWEKVGECPEELRKTMGSAMREGADLVAAASAADDEERADLADFARNIRWRLGLLELAERKGIDAMTAEARKRYEDR